MTKRIETIFGLSTLIVCSVVLVITPWPDANTLFTTHASPAIHVQK